MPKPRFKSKIRRDLEKIGPNDRFLGYADSGTYKYDVWVSELGDRIFIGDHLGNVGTWIPSVITDMAFNGVEWAVNVDDLLKRANDPSVSPNA